MARAYAAPRCAYFVVAHEGVVVGGGGVAPLEGGAADVCELRKMYFLPEARGRGLGERLLRLCLEAARGFGFRACYLETLAGMRQARALYERLGFRESGAMGATGHHGCNRFYVISL